MKPLKKRMEGAISLGCLPLIITIALLWAGGQGVYTAIRNRQPTVLTYDEYVRTKPRAEWLELKDCRLALPEASYRTGRIAKEVKEAFIPVHSSSGKDPDKIQVLVASKDPETLQLLKEVSQVQDMAAAAKVLGSHGEKLFPRKDVKGLVRFGIDMKDKDRRKLAALDKDLAEDFIIIDEGKQPNLGTSAVLLLIGLVLGLVIVTRGGRSKGSPKSAPTPPPLPGQS